MLSDFSISIPERGTLRAMNAGRDPDLEPHPRSARGAAAALRLSLHRLSGSGARGTDHHDAFVRRRRGYRARDRDGGRAAAAGTAGQPPGVAEAIDWAEAATLLAKTGAPWPDAFRRAIGVALKDEEDLAFIAPRLDAIIAEIAA